MSSQLSKVGSIDVIGLQDGVSRVSPGIFGAPDLASYRALIGSDGRVELPISAFVVRTRGTTALIDAGLGDRTVEWQPRGEGPQALTGGRLPAALAEAGLGPEDVDVVLLTHLHLDHNGWVWHEDAPTFPNATVRFGAADWAALVAEHQGDSAHMMRSLAELGRVQPIDADGEVLPGISALATPGHTPGHMMYVLASGGERAMILGDAISCPVQIEAPELEALADVDRALGIATRDRVLRELEGSDTLVGGPHFPGLEFGRVVVGNGRRTWS
jgi:glyoxylase-like metal-dependent hydrolase (beta-lactamase superfamily II)